MLLPLAHHPAIEAMAFVAPVLILTTGLAVLALRDRLRTRRETRDGGE